MEADWASAGSALSAIGPGGLVAAADIGALIAAAAKIGDMTIKTGEWAEGVLKFAKATGQSTAAVQQWDFVAAATGIPVEQMRSGVEGIGRAVGTLMDNLAKGKSSPNMRVFEAILGTDSPQSTDEKLRQLGDLQHILPVILDYAAKLSPLEREGLTKVLHIDPETLNSMIDARDQMAGLIATAKQYGIVVDDSMIKKSAEAASKMHVAAAIIQGEMRTALAGLVQPAADAALRLAKVTLAIEDIARGANDALAPVRHFIDALNHLPGATPGKGPDFGKIVMNALPPGVRGVIGFLGDLRARGESDRLNPGNQGTGTGEPSLGGLGNVKLPGLAGGHGARAPKDQTDEVAQHINEMMAQADGDVLKAKRDELTAQLASTKDEQQRAAIQAQINQIDDAARDAESVKREQANNIWLDEVKHKKGVSAADIKTAEAAVKAANLAEEEARLRQSGVASQRDLNALAEKRADAEKLLADAEKESLQARMDMLKAELPLVHTMQQRRDIELQLFDLEEQQKEAELRATIANQETTPDQRATAQSQLNSLLATLGMRRQATSNANPAGPWDAAMKKMSDDTLSLTDEWQTLASSGIERFNADLFDAQGRVQNLGQVFRSVIQDMLKMLEQYLMRQAEIGLFGGGQGASGPGGGGIISQIGQLFGAGGAGSGAASAGMSVSDYLSFGGYAEGGLVRARGTGTSDSGVARVSDREFIVKASAAQRFLPALMAMNADRPIRIPHYAGGGEIGGSGDLASFAAPQTHHWHIDASIHAPGADPAMLNRVIEGQKQLVRSEPQRWAAYAQAAGVIPKPRRR